MSALGTAFDAAQQRGDGMTEDDVYGPEQPTPEQQRILDKWCAPDYEPSEEYIDARAGDSAAAGDDGRCAVRIRRGADLHRRVA